MNLYQRFKEYISDEKKYSLHTIIAYENDVHQFFDFIDFDFEKDNIVELDYTCIRNWIVQLKDFGLENKSINRKISSLQLFFKYLLKIDEIKVSPLVKHRSLRVAKREEIPFSEKEIEQVLSCFENDFSSQRDSLIIELLYATGMRRGELVGLKDSSFDLFNQNVKVLGKRNKERIIPLFPSLVKKIEYYLIEKQTNQNTSYFFIDDQNQPITSHYVYKTVCNSFEKVSTKLKRSPHLLRHSFATHMLNNGANLSEVKELLGHASLASTQVYTHNSIARLKSIHSKAHPRSKH